MSGAPKLFAVEVSITHTAYVVAFDPGAAEELASTSSEVKQEVMDLGGVRAHAKEAIPPRHKSLPWEAEASDIPAEFAEKTLAWWHDRAMAEQRAAQRDEEFRRRQLVIPGTEVVK